MFFLDTSKLLLLIPVLTLALPTLGQDIVDHDIKFDLYQNHVDVSRDKVIDQFLLDIMAMGVADVQTHFQDKIIAAINGPNGVPTGRVDLTIALTDLYIVEAREKKKSSGKRKQEDWAKGFATFSVRRKGHGIPETESSHPSTVKTHPIIHAEFLNIFNRVAGSIYTSLVCVPCDKVWGVYCSAGGDQPCTPQAVRVPI